MPPEYLKLFQSWHSAWHSKWHSAWHSKRPDQRQLLAERAGDADVIAVLEADK